MVKNRITVNNVTVEVEEGSHVVVHNGVLYVNGEAVQSQLSGEVHIVWHGDLASLEADGPVSCRDVGGNIMAGGSVHCRYIEGSVTAGGSVHARGSNKVVIDSATGVVVAQGGSGGSVRVGHGDIRVGDITAGGSVHARGKSARYGRISAGGSVHLDD